MLLELLYFGFVHISLLIPGYVIVTNTRLLKDHSGIELCFGYLVSVALFAVFATAGYTLNLNPLVLQVLFWLLLLGSLAIFFYQKKYEKLLKERFPLACFLAMTVFSLAFIGLSYQKPYSLVPDPEPRADRNYSVFNVKVLNVSQTNANDNYIPYRQAQFFVNRSDPGKDSFIDEWGVHFFQRTPLMGAVTAEYFTALNDSVPIDYLWSNTSLDPSHTYIKFQTIAQILNALFVLPAFYIIRHFFDRKAAKLALLFMVPSQFFLYNAVFTWPKSLVAFFILLSWLLIFQNKFRYLVMAGIASGLAYLSHDLAVLYIGASVLLLLYQKRFWHIIVFGFISSLFALPWLVASVVFYKKPSSFILYPLSIHDIPQPTERHAIIKEFFDTSPLRLLAIRLDSLYFLLTPYQLIYREAGQEWVRRIWAVGIYSIPGALGLGLIIPAIIGAIKNIKLITFWILCVAPILLCVIVIGWPKGLGAIHFAQASIALLTGLAASWLIKNKNVYILSLVYLVNTFQFLIFMVFSFSSEIGQWFRNPQDLFKLTLIIVILLGSAFCGFAIQSGKYLPKKYLPKFR